MSEQPSLNFSTILAASIHDMKNSLFFLNQSLDSLNTQLTDLDPNGRQELAKIHYEAERLNTHLLQLLALYRYEQEKLPLTVDECFVAELVQEIAEKNEIYANNRNIAISIETDEDLVWFLDYSLLVHLLNDVVVNALRYTHSKIEIKANVIEEELWISIYDDGRGFPENMLSSNVEFDEATQKGKSGLGLYFASMVAKAHKNRTKQGRIVLQNKQNGHLNVFSIVLP